MSEGDVSNAIFKILEKELKKFNKFIPSGFFLKLKEKMLSDSSISLFFNSLSNILDALL